MPEGDTIHRAALRTNAALAGGVVEQFLAPRLTGTLPAVGATVGTAEARGKHLLVPFSDGLVLHVHLGLHGAWRVAARRGPGMPKGRVVVATADVVAAAQQAPVVEILDEAALRRHPKLRRLGPDLTVPGVDVEAAVERLGRIALRGTMLGDALLDQRPAAGIGNVIMQEAVFLQRLDPRTPVERVAVDERRAVYEESARLLQENVHRSRRTSVPGAPEGSLYVYNRSRRRCRVCGTAIEVGRPGRDARPWWWCPTCQELR